MIKSNLKKQFSCSKELLWKIITDNDDFSWRSDLSDIQITDDTHFIEIDKSGYPTYFTITKKEMFKEYRFDLENSNIKGRWIGKFEEIAENVIELDFTEEIEAKNLLIKLLAKSYLQSQQKKYCRDLQKKIDQEN